MDVSYELSDRVKVTIRKKDQNCYVELSSETNTYFISSDVWLKTDWVSKLDDCLDTNVWWDIENLLFVNQMDRFYS